MGGWPSPSSELGWRVETGEVVRGRGRGSASSGTEEATVRGRGGRRGVVGTGLRCVCQSGVGMRGADR